MWIMAVNRKQIMKWAMDKNSVWDSHSTVSVRHTESFHSICIISFLYLFVFHVRIVCFEGDTGKPGATVGTQLTPSKDSVDGLKSKSTPQKRGGKWIIVME